VPSVAQATTYDNDHLIDKTNAKDEWLMREQSRQEKQLVDASELTTMCHVLLKDISPQKKCRLSMPAYSGRFP
jgi:hypothetical protein